LQAGTFGEAWKIDIHMTEKMSKYDPATLLLIETLKHTSGNADFSEVAAAHVLIEEIEMKTGLSPKHIIFDATKINEEMGYGDELRALSDLANDLLGNTFPKKIKYIVKSYFQRRNP